MSSLARPPRRVPRAARRLLAGALGLAAAVACRQATPPSSPTSSPEPGSVVVARWGELAVTAAEVDARVLALPAAERPRPGEDLDAWYEEQIREVAVERRLRAEADESGLAQDAAFVAAEREAGRRIALQLCAAGLTDAAIPEGELRAAYDARADAFASPERRAVFHLFLRSTAERSAAAARVEIAALRERALRGESFRRLAAAHSDSESRHREGSIGWVTPGQLPAGFEEAIFGLTEGVPSEPVATGDGVHLFYVDRVLPPRRVSFEEASPALRERLAAERRRERAAEECGEEPAVDAGELAARLDAWRREALLDAQRRGRLLEVAQRDEARLRLFYDSNRGLFSTPPAWHLRRLRVPLDARAPAAMARLEAAASRPDADLEALAAELGGEVDDLGFQTLAELGRLTPKLPPLVAPLGAGSLSPPYRARDAVEVVEVRARREAEPRPFAEARERVAVAYVRQYTREVYRELTDELLAGDELRVVPGGVAALRAGLVQPAESDAAGVEELADLLDEGG